MAVIKPFRGLRPVKKLAEQVAAPPYDVLDSDEARQMAQGNPYTFLHVNKPEIDFDASVDIYSPEVYEKGAANLQKLQDDGVMLRDEKPCFYLYRQVMGAHQQTGLVAGASVEDYEKNIIKKHEFTRPDKEDDRVKHILHQNAQVGPVFLTYRAQPEINRIMNDVAAGEPEYHFTGSDGVQHTLWVIENQEIIEHVTELFAKTDYLYVADGHHRSAAAQRVRDQKRTENPAHNGMEEYNYFLTVIFPHDQMQILDYNRVVTD
ncbi:MAG: DUF1015 domain-containing protein, partial [Calditrichia bacterium]